MVQSGNLIARKDFSLQKEIEGTRKKTEKKTEKKKKKKGKKEKNTPKLSNVYKNKNSWSDPSLQNA
jgi:hypothetical protein